MCLESETLMHDTSGAATSGSARDFLVPQSDELIYILIFILFIFMHSAPMDEGRSAQALSSG